MMYTLYICHKYAQHSIIKLNTIALGSWRGALEFLCVAMKVFGFGGVTGATLQRL